MTTMQATGLEHVRVIEIASNIKGPNLEDIANVLAEEAANGRTFVVSYKGSNTLKRHTALQELLAGIGFKGVEYHKQMPQPKQLEAGKIYLVPNAKALPEVPYAFVDGGNEDTNGRSYKIPHSKLEKWLASLNKTDETQK